MTGSLASTVGAKNPFRYRSYYYDAETGFYYLQSRYDDPEVGRLINADGYEASPGNPEQHKEMDLHNNELGRRIAIEYKGQGYDVFSEKIQQAIDHGEARIIK